MKFRMVRTFPPDGNPMYRVESSEPMTEQEALQLLRDLDSPYHGQRYPNKPRATSTDTKRLDEKRSGAPAASDEEAHWVDDSAQARDIAAVRYRSNMIRHAE